MRLFKTCSTLNQSIFWSSSKPAGLVLISDRSEYALNRFNLRVPLVVVLTQFVGRCVGTAQNLSNAVRQEQYKHENAEGDDSIVWKANKPTKRPRDKEDKQKDS